MSFSEDDLILVLSKATSQNASEFRPASQMLKNSESQPGFHYALLKIILSHNSNLEVNVRWMASLLLKNGIDRHWRIHGPSPMAQEEKTMIKNEILNCFEEPVQQVCLMNFLI